MGRIFAGKPVSVSPGYALMDDGWMRAKVFRDYDQAELDRQYDQRAWAANAVALINGYSIDSEIVRERLGEPEVHAYGEGRAETLDLFRTERPNAPIHVFVHGGAWRTLGKRDSAFAAEHLVRSGAHFAALDFALLPYVSLDEIVWQVKSAIAWLYRNAAALGADPERIFVSGHSSGAHLAAAAITSDWKAEFDLPFETVKGAVCCSGIYDLEPVRRSGRNRYVQLDERQVEALSPIRHVGHLTCPVVIACGEHESDEFKRQARDFAAAVERHRVPVAVELVEGPGLNHFEIINTLGSPTGLLGQLALRQMGLTIG
jgi:arylformamidase